MVQIPNNFCIILAYQIIRPSLPGIEMSDFQMVTSLWKVFSWFLGKLTIVRGWGLDVTWPAEEKGPIINIVKQSKIDPLPLPSHSYAICPTFWLIYWDYPSLFYCGYSSMKSYELRWRHNSWWSGSIKYVSSGHMCMPKDNLKIDYWLIYFYFFRI